MCSFEAMLFWKPLVVSYPETADIVPAIAASKK